MGVAVVNAHGARIAGDSISRTPTATLNNHRAVPITGVTGRLARCTFCDLRWPWGAALREPVCVTRPWSDR